MIKQRRWLLWLSVAWGVLLLAAGLYAVRNGPATVKEQRTITQAQPVVDKAAQAVIAAAGPDPGVVISGYELRDSCQINAIRPGLNYQRVVQFYLRPGTERSLLETLHARLPKSYRPTLTGSSLASPPGVAGGTLFADAGEFVRVTGTVAGTGQVRVTAYTGCRPIGAGPVEFRGEPNKAPVAAVFGALGVEPQEWRVHRVGCVQTTVAKAAGAAPGPLPARFVGKELIMGTDDLVFFRDGPVTVVVTVTGDGVTVARTETACQ